MVVGVAWVVGDALNLKSFVFTLPALRIILVQ
jgi:hypothetical protein